MFNRKRLITALVVVVATVTFVIAVVTVAGMLLFRSSSNTVAMPGATAFGVPNGPATTKRIGTEGGSIGSPDGKIVVDVPPNAVTGPVDFSIQPITNLAHGGLGNAYRLEPSEQKFATPIKVSFNFDAQELKGIIPETLAVAYQDKTGVWQAFRTVNIDQASKTLTVSTTHFSDFSLWTVRLSPEKATLRVRETQNIELIGCIEKLNWRTRLRALLRGPDCAGFRPQDGEWSIPIGYGTITPVAPGAVVYQAPAKKPSPNVFTVRFVYHLGGSGQIDLKDVRTCEITIVDRGYTASGQSENAVYSGVICDLAKEFTVNATGRLANFTVIFVPSSPTKGTASYSTSYQMVTEAGAGSYTVEGIDTDKPKIVWNVSATATVMGRSYTRAGIVDINLTPLETDECSKK